MFLLVRAERQAPAEQASPSVWNRAVDATTGFLRRPGKRDEKPSPVSDAQRATWNEPRPKGKAGLMSDKAGAPVAAAEAKRANRTSRSAKKPSRTIYEYMAQERP
jgi:hypothetical protein